MNIGEEFVLLASGEAPTGTELSTRQVRVGNTDLRVGIDSDGFRHLLVQVPEEITGDRQSAALVLGTRILAVGSESVVYADLKCLDTRLALVFERLVADVAARIDAGDRPGAALLTALHEWRDLFRGVPSGPTREQVVGLIGELEVLGRLSGSVGIVQALDAWWGPDGHAHDFYSSAARAIEVKTTRSLEGNRIHVSNAAQLDPTDLADLCLAVFRLKEDRRAPSLDERIESLLELGYPAAELLAKIEGAGYVYETPIPFNTRFAVTSDRWWVVGADFPGVRESRLGPTALRGVSAIKYELSLDAVGAPMTAEHVDALVRGWRNDG
ncbi:PD-(D/E)XK motif protein [Pedococcus dokdonensis]|uniref:PD-(D/E)XK motif protein n=1 Tax=Pedococcus dokdonensis TaxID=443156 RepID=UPI0012FE1518|nr:PD-(D/E)XK motif protein [Pedococcus dokdonensis]